MFHNQEKVCAPGIGLVLTLPTSPPGSTAKATKTLRAIFPWWTGIKPDHFQHAAQTVGMIFTLRDGEQTGYPPGDVEITALLHSKNTAHGIVVTLLAGAIAET
jgi:hypothetical protein